MGEGLVYVGVEYESFLGKPKLSFSPPMAVLYVIV